MKTLKKIGLLILITSVFTVTSCKKKKEAKELESNIDKIEGTYLGSGETAAGAPFINKQIKITKVSSNKIKIEPVGHSFITAVEVNVMYLGTAVTSTDDEETEFAVQMAGAPFTIAFEGNNNETFGGTRQ